MLCVKPSFDVAFGLLVTVTVMLLPETSSPHERSNARLRDAAGTYGTLLRNTPFMLYILTGACAVGMLLAYITGSSFIYFETLGVTPSLFAVLFGVNAIGFVGASQLNRVFLRHLRLLTVTRGAVTAAVLVALLLLAVVASGHASTLTLTVLFFALSAAIGCIFPNIAALAFGTVRERMGSAAALQGTLQSVFGGVAGGLVGALGNGTPLPVLGIITGFAALAAVFLLAAHRRRPEAYIVPRTPLPDPGKEPR